MRHFAFLLVLTCFHFNSYGQSLDFTPKEVDKDYYTWLTSLTEGPIDWFDQPKEKTHGQAFRIAITTSEIYQQLYIEQVTYGNEGCCKTVAKSRELDLYEVYGSFGLTGEISGIAFHRWIDANSCEITIQKKIYRLSQLDKKKISMDLVN